jgi:hypothetical protein
MNKLRELIAEFKKNRGGGEWLELQDFICDRREAIADLIDEAHKIGLTLRKDHPLSVALSKLEK